MVATSVMRRFGLRYQLTGWFLLIGVLPSAALSAYAYSVTRAGLFREAAILMRADADATADLLAESFGVVGDQLVLASEQVTQRVLDAKVNQRLKPRPKGLPHFDLSPATNVLTSWGRHSPVPLETWSVVDTSIEPRLVLVDGQPGTSDALSDRGRELAAAAQAAADGEVVFGGVEAGVSAARLVATFATPIIGADGAAIGSLHGAIPVEQFQRALEVRFTTGGTLWVFDQEGQVALTTDAASNTRENAGALFASGRAREGRLARVFLNGAASAAVSVPLAVAGSREPWTVAVSAPEETIAVRAQPWRYVAAVAGLMVVVIVGGMLISAMITRPITTLEEGTRRIAQGDLEFHLRVRGHNELKQLAASFHQMAYALKRAEERLTKAERLAAIGEESLQIHRELNALSASVLDSLALLKVHPDLPAAVREQIHPLYDRAVQVRDAIQRLESVHDHARGPVRSEGGPGFATAPAPEREVGGAA